MVRWKQRPSKDQWVPDETLPANGGIWIGENLWNLPIDHASNPSHPRPMTRYRSLAALLCFGLALGGCARLPEQASPPMSSRELTLRRCGGCHAVTLTDASPHPNAPPLRDMFKRYPVYALGEALRKSIEVGHRDMPRFALSADESSAIISYLDSLNPCAAPSSDDSAMERCFSPL